MNKLRSIEVADEVAPRGFVMPGGGGMGEPIRPDSFAGLSRPMPTGHELGLEGRETGGDDGLPTGQDVSRPAALGVRLRSLWWWYRPYSRSARPLAWLVWMIRLVWGCLRHRRVHPVDLR